MTTRDKILSTRGNVRKIKKNERSRKHSRFNRT